MFTRRSFGLAVSATLLPAPGWAAMGSPSQPAPDLLAQHLAGRTAPGGFVAVCQGYRLRSFLPWGEASKSFRQPVTDRTLFHIGSVGKHVTAAAILRLEEAGKLDTNQPLATYLQDMPPAWAAVPVRHLLSHTSGIPDYLNELNNVSGSQSRSAIIAAAGSVPLNFAPGEAWAYSNTGYLLLGWIIDAVSPGGYASYMRDLLAAAAAPHARLDAAGDVVEYRAEPYTFADGRLVHALRMESGASATGDGGILMSARDLVPWNTAFHGGKLLPAAKLQRALAPAPLLTGRQAPYNCGFHLAQTRGQKLHHHSGSVDGFLSHWAALPDRSIAALAVANYDGPNGPSLNEMAHAALEVAAPGSTYLSLPTGKADARSRALAALLRRRDSKPDPGILAPELPRLGPRTRGVPRMRAPFESLLPIESYEANGGTMVRYRLIQDGRARHPLVGWTKDERLFWLA